MLTELSLTNWKSFGGETTLFIDPLTFVIGVNASGKSNILDALSFLQKVTSGQAVADAARSIRGGADNLIHRGAGSFTLTAKMDGIQTGNVIIYRLSCKMVDSEIVIETEELLEQKRSGEKMLFSTIDSAENNSLPTTNMRFFQEKRGPGKNIPLSRIVTTLSQVHIVNTVQRVKEAAACAVETLSAIRICNPNPDLMRTYSALSPVLKEDGSNVAGVLAMLPDDRKSEIEGLLTTYVKPLPDKDLLRVWTEKIEPLQKDAMLYCEEGWTTEGHSLCDASTMSDGTLRFIAIALCLLLSKPKSLVCIEEIDNGLHPSRAKNLVRTLREISEKNGIDVLCTTHNPALVDALGSEMIPYISYVSRDTEDGSAVIKLLEDLPNIVQLLAQGGMGSWMTSDSIK